jgi:hypothetical protein
MAYSRESINVLFCMFQIHKTMLRCLSITSVKCFQGKVVQTASYSSHGPKVAVVCITFFKWLFPHPSLPPLHLILEIRVT